jgi:hypothetical protein
MPRPPYSLRANVFFSGPKMKEFAEAVFHPVEEPDLS